MEDDNLNKDIANASEKHEMRLRNYIAVWVILIIFTIITVTTANLNLGKIAIIAVLAIAATKSTIVLLYFMHLRYEKRLIIKFIIPFSLIVLAIFIGLTYIDVIAR
jgi:cytochrome c oxidase subunit IV